MKMESARVLEWMPEMPESGALFAEGLGTAVLVLASAGAGSAYGAFGGAVGGAQTALAPGLTLMTLILLFGRSSQGHFNPAVTLGMALAGRFPKTKVLPYAAAQCGGALAAGTLLRLLLRSTMLGISATQMHSWAALLLEAILSFWLIWVYLAVSEKGFPLLHAALALGATVSAALFWAGPLSGASMNPARSLGPALAAGEFEGLWIYLIGPCVGAAAGGAAYRIWKGSPWAGDSRVGAPPTGEA
jgi:MIP family channel proteins